MPTAKAIAAGFTLVELSVVLVLMGLIAAMVIPNFANRPGDPLEDAERFAAVLHHAAEASILSGSAMGIEISADQYRILHNRRGQWIPLDQDPAFRARVWSNGLDVFLSRSGSDVSTVIPGQPAILFRATGEATPFSVLLTRDTRAARIDGDALGTLTVRAVEGS